MVDPPTGRFTAQQHAAAGNGAPRSGRYAPRRLQRSRREPRIAMWLLIGLLLIAAVAITAWLVTTVLDGGENRGENRGQPGGVTVDEGDYRGRPAADAVSELADRGLTAEVVDEDGRLPDNPAACLVIQVRPTGIVSASGSVTVSCQDSYG